MDSGEIEAEIPEQELRAVQGNRDQTEGWEGNKDKVIEDRKGEREEGRCGVPKLGRAGRACCLLPD